MMRSDKLNWNVKVSYTGKTAPPSNVNVTDNYKSKGIIVHETLSENLSKDVRESECNIFHKTLSQKNSIDVPANCLSIP